MNRWLWFKFKRKDPSLAQRLAPRTARFLAGLHWIWAHLLLERLTQYTRQRIQICLLHQGIQVCYWFRGPDLPPKTHFCSSYKRKPIVTLCNSWGTVEPGAWPAGVSSDTVSVTAKAGWSTWLEPKNGFLALDGKGMDRRSSVHDEWQHYCLNQEEFFSMLGRVIPFACDFRGGRSPSVAFGLNENPVRSYCESQGTLGRALHSRDSHGDSAVTVTHVW